MKDLTLLYVRDYPKGSCSVLKWQNELVASKCEARTSQETVVRQSSYGHVGYLVGETHY